MTTRTRLSLALMLAASLAGGAFFFNTANAQRADTLPAQRAQARVPGQTATALPDGRLLLLGGEGQGGVTGAASIVDRRTGQSIPLAMSLTIPRADHTATVLPDGSVLVIGGRTKDGMAAIPEVFDPATQTFSTVGMTGSAFRSGHTATLLTDGRVLVVGGSSGDGKPLASEVWDVNGHAATPMVGSIDRQGHTATLLGDGRVLIEGGRGSNGQPLTASSIIDPLAMTVVETREPLPHGDPFVMAASSPVSGARDVPLDARIALRFSNALRAGTLTEQTFILSGPDGPVHTNVVVAEHGRLAFVWPLDPLVEEQTYTLSISGAIDDRGTTIVPATITFTAVARKPGADLVDSEAWRPGTGKDGWRSGRGQSPWESLGPLQAPDGVTAVSGRVLRLDGRPLADVTLEMEGHEAQTDRTGRFLLRLEGLATGEHTLEIDARTANKPGRTYGFYEARIIVRAGGTNVLPFTIWSPLIDTAHQMTIASPTLKETLITTPLIPGLELHLPAGTVIRDEEGQVARTISITPVPLDRTPFPLPENATFSMFFTIQPGGAYLHTPGPMKGGWLVYPRVGKSQPGRRVQFFDYDPHDKGWYPYGMGTVTATQVVPDAKTRIYALTGASFNDDTMPPVSGPPPGCCGNGGDPVNLTTGIFTYEMTDLVVNDVMPLALTRTYASQDTDPLSPRAFGIGMTMSYSIFLHSEVLWQEADLILPDGGRVHFVRTPESGPNWWQTIFEHTTSPTGFYKSRIAFWGNHLGGPAGWELKQKDGTVYVFGHQAPLQAIRDRNGNEIRLTWSAHSTFGSGKGNLLRVTSPNGRWIAFTYYSGTGLVQTASDNIGRTVSYTYDGSGRLWKVADPLNHVTEYTYDDNNRMVKIKNRNGVEYVTNEYTTAADAPTPVGWVKKQTNPDGGVYEFTYNVVNGKSTSTDVKDPRGYMRRVTFNPDGYTLTDTRALGQLEEETTSSDRPSGDNFVSTSTDNLQTQTVYARDALGNATSVTRCSPGQSPCTESSPDAVTIRFTYEPRFNQVATVTDALDHTTTYGYDQSGNRTSITDPSLRQTTMTYNARGQQTSATDALQHTKTFGYIGGDLATITDELGRIMRQSTNAVGQLVAVTDPSGGITRYEYNGNGELTEVTDALGGVTQYSYDPEGLLQSVTDARNHSTSYTYDAMNNLASRIDPLLNTDRFQTDLDGNPSLQTDRRGQATTRTYDGLDRLRQTVFADASTITYTYDAKSRLTEIDDSLSGTIVREYDDLDRLTSETTPQGSISYTYDIGDRRATMTVAGQPTVTYGYDDANRLISISQSEKSVTITYDDAGRRTGFTAPNGIEVEYAYDDASQLIEITYKQNETPIGNLTYTYDLSGRRAQVGGAWARTRLPHTVQDATYDPANRLTQWMGNLLSYDLNGNLASDGLTSYEWNGRDQLTALSGGVSASFAYDAIGRRRGKTVIGTTEFLYDDRLNAIQHLGGGSNNANLIAGDVDEVFLRTDSNGSATLLSDGIGSTLALVNSSGLVETEYTYEPFGAVSASGVVSWNSSQYTGRENDSVELYYYRARYYRPSTGTFISEDPAGFVDGPNLYAYAGGDPVSFTDPSGLTKITVDINAGTMIVDPQQRGRKPYSMPVTSGRGKCTNDSKCQKKPDEGPVPQGAYTADMRNLTNPGTVGDLLRNLTGDWGDWRVPITPKRGTRTYGRDGFFLHGGRFPGSAGCIDVGGGLFGNDATNQLLRDMLADRDLLVPVIVR